MQKNIFFIIVISVLVIVSIIAVVGFGFLTDIVFTKGKKVGGYRCFNISKASANIMYVTVVLLWILIPLQIYDLHTITCNRTNGLGCGEAWGRYVLVALLVLEIVGLVALSAFVFKLKKRAGGYCAVLSDTDHNIAYMSVIALWIGVVVYGFRAGQQIVQYWKGVKVKPITKAEEDKAEKDKAEKERKGIEMVALKKKKEEEEEEEKENIKEQLIVVADNKEKINDEHKDLEDAFEEQKKLLKKYKEDKKKVEPETKESEKLDEKISAHKETIGEIKENLRTNERSGREAKKVEEKLKKGKLKEMDVYRQQKIPQSPRIKKEKEYRRRRGARMPWEQFEFGKKKRNSRKKSRRMRRYL